MDGLSVLEAVVCGVDVIKRIYDTAKKLKDAPESIGNLLTEILITKSILEQLKPFVISNDLENVEGAQHIGVGDLVLVFTDLVKTLSKFDEFVTRMSKSTGFRSKSLVKSSMWLKYESKFDDNLKRLQSQKLSLVTMLALLDR